jgi:predicted SprT family Zn-dependent metalloprotease
MARKAAHHSLRLVTNNVTHVKLSREQLQMQAEALYEYFLPRFTRQREGSIDSRTIISFSSKMKLKTGLALLFENKIRLNQNYFSANPERLAYTIFHEMTHLWLYHCGHDPGHTARFYAKMDEFSETGFAVDGDVHVHMKLVPEAKFIYRCTNCRNRWHCRDILDYPIYCGLCFKHEQTEYFAELVSGTTQGEPVVCKDVI